MSGDLNDSPPLALLPVRMEELAHIETSPTAWLVVRTVDGDWRSEQVELDADGSATVTVPFTVEKVEAVSLTLVNASTRFRCDKDTPDWSCFGIPRDQDEQFALTAEVYER